MGRGVGAVAVVDSQPSPRHAAIERAQEELRRQVAIRDERQRELEFLEKGGNPLDFRFGEAGIHLLLPEASDGDCELMRQLPVHGMHKDVGEDAHLTFEGAAELQSSSSQGYGKAVAGSKKLLVKERVNEVEDNELTGIFKETKRLKICKGEEAESISKALSLPSIHNRTVRELVVQASSVAVLEKIAQASNDHVVDEDIKALIVEEAESTEKPIVCGGSFNPANFVQHSGVLKVKVEEVASVAPVSPSAPSPIALKLSDTLGLEQDIAVVPVSSKSAGIPDKIGSCKLQYDDMGLVKKNMLPGQVDASHEKGVNIIQEVRPMTCHSASDETLHQNTQIECLKSSEHTLRKAFIEPPWQKCHWDFVLEEMAWLANDFMQERLWKMAAGAQLARWVAQERKEEEFQDIEICNIHRRLSRTMAKTVMKYWQSVETQVEKEFNGNASTMSTSCSGQEPMAIDNVGNKVESTCGGPFSIENYICRFVKSSNSLFVKAEAPRTPDNVTEPGVFDFWDDNLPEESLFYTVPNGAMDSYCQALVSQWELIQTDYEQRFHDHEEIQTATEAMDDYGGLPQILPQVLGKRSMGLFSQGNKNVGAIPTKRVRTSALAARKRVAGIGYNSGLIAGSVNHVVRSDISSDTNSQQDEIAYLHEGSSASGRATDAESNGVFPRHTHADGVDIPHKVKRKKKSRNFDARFSDLTKFPINYGLQRPQFKQKGELIVTGNSTSEGLRGLHAFAANTNSAVKLARHISNHDRGRKYKGGKGSLNHSEIGIPWSPVEDQAILGLVYELGSNWELVSDILRSSSQLKGIYRKAKDCKERYKVLVERVGGDGDDSPDDSCASVHLSIPIKQKGGARFLPHHLEETLKSHIECIIHLHRVLHSNKVQMAAQESKPSITTHESHLVKLSDQYNIPTPLELIEQSSSNGELNAHPYPIYSSHGNAVSMLSSGLGMRPVSLGIPSLQGTKALPSSPGGFNPAGTLGANVTRDLQHINTPVRNLTAEERLHYNRIVAGQVHVSPSTSSMPAGLPAASDYGMTGATSGNNSGALPGLNRGLPHSRPSASPSVPNISSGTSNIMTPVVGGLGGTSGVSTNVPSPMNAMRRPTMAVQTHPQSGSLPGYNSSVLSTIASSSTHAAQQQQLSQQQSLGQKQQHVYNMMRAKERQQLQQQQQQQRRILQQQQQGPMSSSPLQSSFARQQQHLNPHMLSHQLQGPTPSTIMPQSVESTLTTVIQSPPQQLHPLGAGTVSPREYHQNQAGKQQGYQQHQLSKNSKAIGRVPMQLSPQQIQVAGSQHQEQWLLNGQAQPGHVVANAPQIGHPLAQSSTRALSNQAQGLLNLQQVSNVKDNSQTLQGKQLAQQQVASTAVSAGALSIQPTSPPLIGANMISSPSIPSQARPSQPFQFQLRRPQQRQPGTNIVLQPGKAMQSAGSPHLSTHVSPFVQGSNMSNIIPPASSSLLASETAGSESALSPQWKPGQNFSPMTIGLYNLSRTNSEAVTSANSPLLNSNSNLAQVNEGQPQQVNARVTPVSSPRQQLAFQAGGVSAVASPPVVMYNGVHARQVHQPLNSGVVSTSSMSSSNSVPSTGMTSSSSIPKSPN